MFNSIKDVIRKKEVLLQNKEPLFYDCLDFLAQKHPALREEIFPIAFTHGILSVRARSSAAVQEFFLIKTKLLEYLRSKNHPVRDIITRLC